MKISDIAKLYNVDDKILVKLAKDLKIKITSAASVLEKRSITKLENKLKAIGIRKKKDKEEKEEKKPAKAKKTTKAKKASASKKTVVRKKAEKKEEKKTVVKKAKTVAKPVVPEKVEPTPEPEVEVTKKTLSKDKKGFELTEARVKSTIIRRRKEKIVKKKEKPKEEITPLKEEEKETTKAKKIQEEVKPESEMSKRAKKLLSKLKSDDDKEDKKKPISIVVEYSKAPEEALSNERTLLGGDVIDKYSEQVVPLSPKFKRAFKKPEPAKPQAKGRERTFYQPARKRRQLIKKRSKGKTTITVPKAAKRIVKMSDHIIVSELAKQLGVKVSEVINKLLKMGMMVTINQIVDFDTVSLVASEFQYEVQNIAFEEEDLFKKVTDKEEDVVNRPPVVTIMGHVDHGKTSLLDVIRKTSVTEQESGGITQHIGAYKVKIKDKEICFIDTPGHEAFTAMRARGASVTDIVILCVAADDGVMPQTKEAINHSKEANVPIIVAINKIDLPGTKPDVVRKELADYGLVPEEWGGDTLFAMVSAKKKEGISELLESILLQSDVMELKANPNKPATGVVIEAKLEKGRGPVVTVLIKEGTLKLGDLVVVGNTFGKVRAMTNDKGEKLEVALPSDPVEVLGLSSVSEAGDELNIVKDEKDAGRIVDNRVQKQKERELAKTAKVSLEDLYSKLQEGATKELKIIVKGDTHGSVEALSEALRRLSNDQVNVSAIHGGVGGISESDVMLASASAAVVIGFNVRAETNAKEIARRDKIEIMIFDIIYDVIDNVKSAMEGMLSPIIREQFIGKAEVRQAFNITKLGTIAGSFVVEGKIPRSAKIKLIRDNVVVHEGKIGSLKRFKDDAKEVTNGQECGIGFENYNDVKEGDIIEAFEVIEEKAKLEAAKPVSKEEKEEQSTKSK